MEPVILSEVDLKTLHSAALPWLAGLERLELRAETSPVFRDAKADAQTQTLLAVLASLQGKYPKTRAFMVRERMLIPMPNGLVVFPLSAVVDGDADLDED